ncbi:MAG: N-acetyl-gamma-glutamyl-phosphate reductase [Demequinaceae bacterium]|nr:N-acetyl-gamma-glutamyl-phosphate reductase [Demequinaceae bacterium]
MTISVAVAGASGYVGGEVLRVFAAHPDVRIGALTANTSVGDSLGLHQPHLRQFADRTIVATTPENLAGHDVVVLALPHGASGEIAATLPDDTLVLDCGADHRLESAEAWGEYYPGKHAGSWPYGLPELITGQGSHQREALKGARRVAIPGCNVTAVVLGIQPGIATGLVDATDIVAVLANGYSGAGRALKPHLLASEGLGAAAAYAVGGIHRHIPEILQDLAAAGAKGARVSFTPVLVPMSRGILATVTAPLKPGATGADVRAAWEEAYAKEPFVHVLPEGQWPSTASTVGANTALIGVGVDEKAGKVITVTAIDNLVKGTAGAALQCLNLALGFPEATGLITEGVAP